MQTYMDRATRVAADGQIAVMVLLSRKNDDLELLPLKPFTVSNPISREEYERRELRSVGVVSMNGTTPGIALREPLPPDVVSTISAAFLEYIRVLLGGSMAEYTVAAEIAELERMFWLLPDTRPN
jgi:hypothetical protein